MDSKLKSCLENLGVQYIEHEHPPVFTVEESKILKKDILGLHTKSLFLKDDKGDFYLVCMSADKRLDIKGLRKYLKTEKLHFASPEELKSHLNLTPGSVSIFGMINSEDDSVTLILEKEVWSSERVNFHPNIN